MSLQFDVIVGNPPYQNAADSTVSGMRGSLKNSYSVFIEQSLDLLKPNGHLVYVCPPGYLKVTSMKKKSALYERIRQLNLVYLNFDCKKHFPTVNLPSITSFVLQNNTNYKHTRIITEKTDEYVNIKDHPVIPLNCSSDTLNKINKLVSQDQQFSFVRDDSLKVVNKCRSNNTNFVVVSQISGGKLNICVNDLIINKKGTNKPIHVMVCESLSEAKEVERVLSSDEATFVNTTIRYGDANVYPGIINFINRHAI